MPLQWEPLDISVYKSWIEAIKDEASETLNDWESNFIDSIDERLSNGRNLTEGQATKLESIYSDNTE